VLAKLLGCLEYDCKSAGLFLWLQKRKRKLNQCVIATNLLEWLQPVVTCDCKKKENMILSVWLKSYLVIWNMIASLRSLWLQKIAGSFLWLQKTLFLGA
jgi:hypothetical protein